MSATPSLSVIVACLNPGPKPPSVLTGLWTQRAGDPEIIVVDRDAGGGSHEWIRAHRKRIGHLLQAPEAGIFDAMNRGLAAATGEWVLLLGPDDRLVGEFILDEALHRLKNTEAGVAIGEVSCDDGQIFKLRSRTNPLSRHLTHWAGTFYRRTLFDENGNFDLSYGLAADYEFHLRLWKNHVRFKPIPLRIAACEAAHAREMARWTVCQQENRARQQYFSTKRRLIWNALATLRWVRSKAHRLVLGKG